MPPAGPGRGVSRPGRGVSRPCRAAIRPGRFRRHGPCTARNVGRGFSCVSPEVGAAAPPSPAGFARCCPPGSYLRTDKAQSALERARDRLAGEIKGELDAAAFSGTGVHDAAGQTVACRALISSAERLAAGH